MDKKTTMMTRGLSSHGMSAFERNLFTGLMLFLTGSVLGYFFKAIGMPGLFSVILRIEVIGGALLLYYAYQKYHGLFPLSVRKWTFWVLLYLVFEYFNALIFAQYRSDSYDIFKWIFFFAMFYLGSTQKYWSYFLRWGLLIMVIASILSSLELIYGNFSYMRGEWGEGSYLYDLQIAYSSIVLFLCYYILSPQKRNTFLTIIIFAFYLILQFYFQKRLPLLRVAFSVALLYYSLKGSYSVGKRFTSIAVIIIIAIVSITLFLPKQYLNATIDRFYEQGSVAETVEEDARYQILDMLVDATFSNPRTFLIGQGMGAVLKGSFYGKKVTINGQEVDGISTFEIGVANLWFQYGLLFVILIYGFIAKLLFRFKKYRGDSLAVSCWIYMTVFFVMNFLGESFPTIHTILLTSTVAPCMGYLASFNRRIKTYTA